MKRMLFKSGYLEMSWSVTFLPLPSRFPQGQHRALLPQQWHQLRGRVCGLLHPGLHVPGAGGAHL